MRVIRVARHALSLSQASRDSRGPSENRFIVLVGTASIDEVELEIPIQYNIVLMFHNRN